MCNYNLLISLHQADLHGENSRIIPFSGLMLKAKPASSIISLFITHGRIFFFTLYPIYSNLQHNESINSDPAPAISGWIKISDIICSIFNLLLSTQMQTSLQAKKKRGG